MNSIEIDDEVYNVLRQQAEPFLDTPNSVLRRLLGIDEVVKQEANAGVLQMPSNKKSVRHVGLQPKTHRGKYARKPRIRLLELIEAGKVQDGERVYLLDHSGNRIVGERFTANISGSKLRWTVDGNDYSMSELASKLLAETKYEEGPARGPKHWEIAGKGSILVIANRFRGKVTDEELEMLENL